MFWLFFGHSHLVSSSLFDLSPQCYSDLAWDDLDTLFIRVNKENSIEFPLNFLHYLYNYYMVCALSSHTPMWPGHVMSPNCDLWLCDA